MSQFQMPGIPQITDPQFAKDLAGSFRQQASAMRSSSAAGYETIRYKVRRGGIAGFFGGRKTVTERRLKPGAQQLIDNANMLEQQAAYLDSLSQGLASLKQREDELAARATAEEEASLEVQKPIGEGGNQYTRNDLTRTDNSRLAILLGYDDRERNTSGISINAGSTLGGLRIPLGT